MARRWDEANAPQRAVRRFAASGPGSWLFARMLDRLDRLTFRVTKGRHLASSLLSALPVAMVTTIGARSGQARTVPLLAMPTDDGLAVIGSNYGKPKHPAWRHNLRANPAGEVDVEGAPLGVPAVEVEDERRERIWQEALRTYPGFATYASARAPRRISVFVLETSTLDQGSDPWVEGDPAATAPPSARSRTSCWRWPSERSVEEVLQRLVDARARARRRPLRRARDAGRRGRLRALPHVGDERRADRGDRPAAAHARDARRDARDAGALPHRRHPHAPALPRLVAVGAPRHALVPRRADRRPRAA